ncbi:BnaA07g09280D [Brassica napus]|uniref:(rape) hypothetical protein n=1 Tax=Brassica napus TaxID=3708 RepID=A0A078HR04_BRANA|nr:unnamed protein product [Brassica napus]CDY40272.1 BnaA07g09280D [Brassica napus]
MPFDSGKLACWRHHRSSPLLVLYVFWLLMMPPSWSPIVSPLRRHGPPTSSLYIYALSPSNSCYYSTVSFTLPSRHIAEPHHSNTDYGLPNQCFRIHLVQSRDVVLSFDPLFLLPSRVGRDLIVYALLLMSTTVKFKQMRHFSTAITYCSGITHIFLPPNSFHLRQRSFEISVQAHPPHLSDT